MCLRVAARTTRLPPAIHKHFCPAPLRLARPFVFGQQLPPSFPRNRSFHVHPYRPIDRRFSPHALRSSSGSAFAALFAGLIVAGALYFVLPERHTTTSASHLSDFAPSVHDPSTNRDILDYYYAMSAQVPPGRPGNLTASQEASLREFWKALFQIFGVYEAPPTPVANGAPEQTNDNSETGKKKKSRLGFLKKKDKDADSSSTSSATTSVTDFSNLNEDDKHGIAKEFKRAMANMTPEQLREAFWNMLKHDNPDAMLLRFLRARKWDVQAALVMLISAMHWRHTEMHVEDDILKHGEEGALRDSEGSDPDKKREADMFLQQLRMGKSYVHGVDKDGRPMSIVRVRLHHAGDQSEASLERFTVHTMETARFLLKPPVDTAALVFDMTDFSLANMDYTPVKFMIKCFEANYPESLGVILIYKAPWIFQGIWSIIKGWLDPVVAGKVNFAKNVDELSNFIPIDQIPTELGGNEKWEYKYVPPTIGENAIMEKTDERDKIVAVRAELAKKFEEQTLNWIREKPSEEGKDLDTERKAIQEERMKIAEELRKNYWDVDPYVRAKSLYDRIGVINPGGRIEHYPKEIPAAEKKAEEVKPVEDTRVDEKKMEDTKTEAPTAVVA